MLSASLILVTYASSDITSIQNELYGIVLYCLFKQYRLNCIVYTVWTSIDTDTVSGRLHLDTDPFSREYGQHQI